MLEAIFHIGMGKTGTTSLQSTLKANDAILRASGVCYLGMWQELISDQYSDFGGFQIFRQLPADQQREAADRLARQLRILADDQGISRFVFSNEQYFENAEQMRPFFERLQSHVSLRFYIWVRPVDSWLPSACAQWGVLHKTNIGPIQPFAEQADRLIKIYANLPIWVDFFGDKVTVRLFDDTTDPVAEFAEQIGVPLVAMPGRRQTRPDATELLLRAAFNTQFHEMVLPDAFNAAIGRYKPLTSAQGITEKADVLLGRNAMPEVIARHRDLLDRLTEAAGFDVAGIGAHPSDLPSDREIIDRMLGRAVEIIAGQALDLAELRARVAALEAKVAT